ncbi:putative membrane protein [Klebsiella phage vB_KqM-Bilbo]|nr:hypothetical protein CQA65_29415 [Klebsiella pneumoniae]CAD5240817.1 putative membrane protein [Klebsiella phage vB_KqM-Bilbo]CAD5240933.1 putative membrane protein [Klebsiella phage vB_KqM-LilBean]
MIIIDGNDIIWGLAVLSLVFTAFKFFKATQQKKGEKKAKVCWGYADLPSLKYTLSMRKRNDDGSLHHLTDFSLDARHPDTSAVEYFYYTMDGLKWPIIGDIVIKEECISCRVYPTDGNWIRVWFFNLNKELEFTKKLFDLFKEYEESGCKPAHGDEPIESIIRRARGKELNELEKYGFSWGDELCQ